MKKIVIIPARLESQRLPYKPLLKINGKSMILHTVERVLKSGLSPIIIATDSEAIFQECSHLPGVHPVMTSEKHTCGTERVLEAYEIMSESLGKFDLIINVQGDEPFIEPEMLKALSAELEEQKRRHAAQFWTTVTDLPKWEEHDENVAKVVLNRSDNALIFAREYIRSALKHTSVYVYTPEFLKKFCSLPNSPLEANFRLEQMRALDHGYPLNCIYLPFDAISINSVEDLEKAGVTDYTFYQPA